MLLQSTLRLVNCISIFSQNLPESLPGSELLWVFSLALFYSMKLSSFPATSEPSPFPKIQAVWHSFLQPKRAPLAAESVQEAMGMGKDCKATVAVKFLQSYLNLKGRGGRLDNFVQENSRRMGQLALERQKRVWGLFWDLFSCFDPHKTCWILFLPRFTSRVRKQWLHLFEKQTKHKHHPHPLPKPNSLMWIKCLPLANYLRKCGNMIRLQPWGGF